MVPVLLRLFEAYGVDWRQPGEEEGTRRLADLRAALVHSPGLVEAFLTLHRADGAATDRLLALAEGPGPELTGSPEAAVHDVFRRHRNHFPTLEAAAEAFWGGAAPERDETYVALKRRLAERLGLTVRLVRVASLPRTLRVYDEGRRELLLSEALDHLATRLGVSYEQARHRATTLQREGAPFFFLRIDKGGNVTKRFSATGFHLALHGGACLRLDVHVSFRTPGRILPQFLEMPDGARFIVVSRTVDRPTWERHAQDNRLAVAMGCAVEPADEVGYAEPFAPGGARPTPLGINCRIGPRGDCDQRAHQAVIPSRPVDPLRRGATRYEA